MSDADLYQNANRNDPCPCGSGKKYKKCHLRLEQLRQDVESQILRAEDVVAQETDPWSMFRVLKTLYHENKPILYHKLLHPQGPHTTAWSSEDDFLQAFAQGGLRLAAHGTYTYLRSRIDEPYMYLLLAKDVNDPASREVSYQVITLYPNELDAAGNPRDGVAAGPRIWDVSHHRRAKADLPEDGDIHLRELGVRWQPRAHDAHPTRQRGVGEEE